MTQRQRQRGSETAWTIAQLAQEIGMSQQFVRSEITAGQIKASKLGREWRIPASEVIRYCKRVGWPVPALST